MDQRDTRQAYITIKSLVITHQRSSVKDHAMDAAKMTLKGPYVFITHAWHIDELGRDNHERVKRVSAALQAANIATWFDESRMRGDVNKKMAEGVDGCSAVVVVVTERYIEKASGKHGANDNCKARPRADNNVRSFLIPFLPSAVRVRLGATESTSRT